MVPKRRASVPPGDREGYAMLAVILVLMALLFLVTPFLATVRNADRASQRRADQVEAGLGLDDAGRLARARLGASHPAVDTTPHYDSLDELAVRNDLGDDFLGPGREGGGARWDLEAKDLAGTIDLDSAPPQVIANMLGLSTRLVAPLAVDDDQAKVASTDGFPESGVLSIGGELVRYGKIEGGAFTDLERGLGVQYEDDEPLPGPLPPRNHAAGAVLQDQRAWALATWRLAQVEPDERGLVEPRRLGSADRLAQLADYVLMGDWDLDLLTPVIADGSVFGDYGAGPRWYEPTRLRSAVVAGKTGEIAVEDTRWFGPGTTLRIHGEGASELAVVRAVNPRSGRIYLDRALMVEQSPFGAVVQAMARRPVNINTASPAVLEALFVNLQLAGRNSRITRDEARTLTAVVVESRPFTGFEDFLERVVLPAAGFEPLPIDAPVIPEVFISDDAANLGGFLDEDDALALYRNALNANDAELGTSTMPFSFSSRDVYRMDLRVSVSAPSGVQRLERRREEVLQAGPAGEVLRIWNTQLDLDEALRLSRAGKLWETGPWPTGRHDAFLGSSPPPRVVSHLGSYAFRPGAGGQRPPIERELPDTEQGFAKLEPYRMPDTGPWAGRMFHFDWEPRVSEGRDLAERPLGLSSADPRLGLTATPGSLMRPVTFSAWIKPRLTQPGYHLDLGGNYLEADRISLVVEGDALVLRVLDGAGDHPATTFEEVAEVRHPLDTAPGLPADVWTHVLVDVRGNRPDQMTLMVDYRPALETPGLTKLTGSLSPGDSQIQVESTEGFPDPCVLRIGEEVIEARVTGPGSFQALHEQVGEFAGFGGRIARERFQAPGNLPFVNGGLGKDMSHSVGTPVRLYGYSVPLSSNVSSAQASLPASIGPFAVARAVGAIGGQSSDGDAIQWQPPGFQNPVDLGLGMEGDGSTVTGVRLAAADDGRDINEVMAAFSPQGGYAVLAQLGWNNTPRAGTDEIDQTPQQTPIFGMEVVHYSGWSGDELYIDRRGDACTELQLLAGTQLLDRHAFVLQWYPFWTVGDTGEQIMNLLNWQTFVVPISVPAAGAASSVGFVPGSLGQSEFAQLTRLGGQAHLTEWVRYDEVVGDQLVRSSPTALQVLANVVTGGFDAEDPLEPPLPEEAGGGGGGGAGSGPVSPPGSGGSPGGQFGGGAIQLMLSPAAPASAGPAPTPALAGPYWDNTLGTDDFTQWPVSHAVRTQFQFRGVLGTYSHEHPAGTSVLPVFRVADQGPDMGWPGRHDQAFLMDYETSTPGWPVTVHRAYRALQFEAHAWERAPDSDSQPLVGQAVTPPEVMAETGFNTLQTLVALTGPAPVPMTPGVANPGSAQTIHDVRETARLVMFPSGELPREVDRVQVGGDIDTQSGVEAVLDELGFLSSPFGLSTGAGDPVLGGSLQLSQEISSSSNTIFVQPALVLHAGGAIPSSVPILDELPADGGLLRIGNELVCYRDYDAQLGTLNFAPGGRGLLGTVEQDHAIGEPVTFLEAFTVSVLTAPVDRDDAALPLEDAGDFPDDGTVLVGGELIHFTRRGGDSLLMPRRSEAPGMRDGQGAGLFRGRYGTTPTDHDAGAPVILFPIRHWDRWAEQADAPELAFLGFSPQQEDAYWQRAFWKTDGEAEGASIVCLVRTDPRVSWDADPVTTPGLYELTSGAVEAEGNPLGFQSDRVEVRVFQRFQPQAYDGPDGISHGWKRAPRLEYFGFSFLAPSSVLTRVWR